MSTKKWTKKHFFFATERIENGEKAEKAEKYLISWESD
jgi:hypothetical protein